jgi:hypothetical protein
MKFGFIRTLAGVALFAGAAIVPANAGGWNCNCGGYAQGYANYGYANYGYASYGYGGYYAQPQVSYAPPTYSYAAPTYTVQPHYIVQPNYVIEQTQVIPQTHYLRETLPPAADTGFGFEQRTGFAAPAYAAGGYYRANVGVPADRFFHRSRYSSRGYQRTYRSRGWHSGYRSHQRTWSHGRWHRSRHY